MSEMLYLFAPAILGLAGGLALALASRWRSAGSHRSSVAAQMNDQAPGTDTINISSIKVAGVGGLGLVAMAAAVALNVPMIGAAMTLGPGFGILLAAGLILYARRTGPMPSSGKGIGASTVLSLRETSRPDLETGKHAPDDLRRDAVLVPAR